MFPWWRLEDVFRLCLQKTFPRRFQDVLIKTNIVALVIRLQDVLSTFSRCLQDVFKTSCQDILKTFSRRFQDVLQKRLQDVFKRYNQVKLFSLTSLRGVFNMFLRRTAKTVIYRRIYLGHTSEKFIVSVQNLQEW